MNQQLMKYVPARLKNAVQDIYQDEDGYWAIFKVGYKNSDGGHTVHEDTIREFIAAMREIR